MQNWEILKSSEITVYINLNKIKSTLNIFNNNGRSDANTMLTHNIYI